MFPRIIYILLSYPSHALGARTFVPRAPQRCRRVVATPCTTGFSNPYRFFCDLTRPRSSLPARTSRRTVVRARRPRVSNALYVRRRQCRARVRRRPLPLLLPSPPRGFAFGRPIVRNRPRSCARHSRYTPVTLQVLAPPMSSPPSTTTSLGVSAAARRTWTTKTPATK